MKKTLLTSCIILYTLSSVFAQQENWSADSSLSINTYTWLHQGSTNHLDPVSGNYFQGAFNVQYQSQDRYSLFNRFKAPEDFKYQPILETGAVTQVLFSSGYFDRQGTRIVHQQKFAKHELLFGFLSNKSVGLLQNQGLDQIGLQLGLKGNLSKRWTYALMFRGAKYRHQLNAGITSDSLLDQDVFQFNLLDVPLTQAKETHYQRRMEGKIAYGFGAVYSEDSIPVLINYKHSFYLQNKFTRNSRLYEDQFLNLNYYPAIYLDSLTTYDSNAVFTNSAALGANIQVSEHLNVDVSAKYNYIGFYASQVESGRIQPSGQLKAVYKKEKLNANFEYEQFVADQLDGDFRLKADGSLKLTEDLAIGGQIRARRQTPLAFYSSYLSNHHFWDQQLGQESEIYLGASLKYKGLRLSVFNQNLNGLLYLQDHSIQQESAGVSIQGLQLFYTLNVRRFEWESTLIAQTTDSKNVLLSPLVSRQVFAIGFDLFPKKIPFKFIVDHYAMMPSNTIPYFDASLGMFTPTKMENGGEYPIIQKLDVGIGVKIASARVYLRAENILDLFIPQKSFYAPGFMLNPYSLKLGIAWRVFN